ncbi:hypothetical protein F925_00637 [Acinetobacter lwoffii NCTC 5866 = CIP 64.10 = NIPH 512]|nr:hypothetical protein F925_00637 [Acinetobacter lwoffii NCTC 5866 = CIP 64.10 = NIPH 512]
MMSMLIVSITLFSCIVWMFIEFKKNGFTLLLMSLVWFTVIYCLSPIALMSSYDEVANPRFLANSYQLHSVFPQFVVLLFLCSFYFGALVGNSTKIVFYLNEKENTSTKVSFILFLMGIFSLFFYIYAYGGLSYVLQNMSQIRSGTADIKNYLAAFLYSFSRYLNLAFLIMLAVLLFGKLNTSSKKIVFFLILGFCLFSIYLRAGREAGISFLISTLVVFYFSKGKLPIVATFLFFLVAMFYILFGKIFLFALNNENFDKDAFIENKMMDTIYNSYNLIISEFTHQYLSLVNFLQNDYSFRFFGDYLYWLLKPLKLLGVEIPDSISYYNTYMIYGVWDSEIPPGAVAFGYIGLGAIGVIIHGFVLGYIFRSIDRVFNPKQQSSSIILGFYALLVSSFTYLISNSDPALFLQNRIPHFLFFIILILFVKAKFVRKN